ncbi:MAG: nucleotidyl transferase AbiEii/AbiGii toxin family protein [Candidatus Aenigmarchaeota archaeon]|nr:nucleotidyl transferase AbiEii/AbiGii toxin family protein [Candidatus Aenigmarchaeota archaeon]
MLGREYLEKLAKKTDMGLYQQEKDYLLKLFLFYYYKRFSDAVFKGGTCIKYLYGIDRFSEDLDFNITISPEEFLEQAKQAMDQMKMTGIENGFIKKEIFADSFACEIFFHGPLFRGISQTRNKIRIDAGKRTKVILKPEWQTIYSEYPETGENFMILTMNRKEMLAEKIIAAMSRKKGRDLYDVWFLLKTGIAVDKKLLQRKAQSAKTTINMNNLLSKNDYERDMKRVSRNIVPYEQVREEVKEAIGF